MTAAEGAEPILHRGIISLRRHPVVDRHGGAQRGLRDAQRDPPPLPPAGEGTYGGKEKGFAAVVFRVAMETLAEEERGAGAVRDVPQTNASVKGEDAVPGQAGKGRRSARMKRPLAGVAAITGHRIETPRPERGGLCR